MRNKLPDRRIQITRSIPWDNTVWDLSVGFDHELNAKEIFVKGLKVGTAREALMDDTFILASHLLQRGMTTDEMQEALTREPVDVMKTTSSELRYIIDMVVAIEKELKEEAGL